MDIVEKVPTDFMSIVYLSLYTTELAKQLCLKNERFEDCYVHVWVLCTPLVFLD